MVTFAEKLKHLRETAGLTQAALAQQSGLSLGIVRDYEQGRKEPALRSAFKLAAALGVDCSAFKDCIDTDVPDKPAAKAEGKPPSAPKRPTSGAKDGATLAAKKAAKRKKK